MWSWSPVIVTPDGGGISSGDILTADCIGISTGVGQSTPSCIYSVDASASNTSTSVLDIYGYGLRDCIGLGNGTGLCDVGGGLTVIKSGVEYRDVNILDFSGNLTLSSTYGKALINILAGSGTTDVPYATRIDFLDATTMYKGEAAVGTADADALWRISKYVFAADSDVTITWASGNDNFDKVWNNRLALSYS